MKFTKTFVAVAIAGIAAAPMAASAATTLSGVVQVKLEGSDADDINAVADDPATPNVDETVLASSPGDPQFAANDIQLNINSQNDIGNGLIGYGNIRLDVDALSNSSDNSPSPDSVYVGLKGGFGDIRLGEVPLSVEVGQVANDIYDVGAEISGGASYRGDFGPVNVLANFSPENNLRSRQAQYNVNSTDAGVFGLGASVNLPGFSIGVGGESRADDVNYAVGVTAAVGPISAAAHYWFQDFDIGDDGDLESFAVKVGTGFGAVTGSLTFATLESDDSTIDKNAIRLDLAYNLGTGTSISTRITSETDDSVGGEDLAQYRVMLSKSF